MPVRRPRRGAGQAPDGRVLDRDARWLSRTRTALGFRVSRIERVSQAETARLKAIRPPFACNWLQPRSDVEGVPPGYRVRACAPGARAELVPPCSRATRRDDHSPRGWGCRGSRLSRPATPPTPSSARAKHCGCVDEAPVQKRDPSAINRRGVGVPGRVLTVQATPPTGGRAREARIGWMCRRGSRTEGPVA